MQKTRLDGERGERRKSAMDLSPSSRRRKFCERESETSNKCTNLLLAGPRTIFWLQVSADEWGHWVTGERGEIVLSANFQERTWVKAIRDIRGIVDPILSLGRRKNSQRTHEAGVGGAGKKNVKIKNYTRKAERMEGRRYDPEMFVLLGQGEGL